MALGFTQARNTIKLRVRMYACNNGLNFLDTYNDLCELADPFNTLLPSDWVKEMSKLSKELVNN